MDSSQSAICEIDFYSLGRRDLQALCKKNKIPANITNVAMADALKALETVEGLEEFLNQRASGNLDDSVPESPHVSVTATKTATRKKPIPSARKLVSDEDGDVPYTPAVQTGRRRAPAASALKKVEEATVQHGYSTRRSVRLLEKCMDQLTLSENSIEPVKMGLLDNDIKEKKEETSEAKDGDEQKYDTSNIDVVKTEVADQTVAPIDVKGKSYNEETHVSEAIVSEEPVNTTTERNDSIIDDEIVADEVVSKDFEVEKLNLNVKDEQKTEDSPAQVFNTESTLKPEVEEDLAEFNIEKFELNLHAEVVLPEENVGDDKDEALNESLSEEETFSEEDTLVISEVNHVDEKDEPFEESFSEEEISSDDEMESDKEDVQTEAHLDTKIEPSDDDSELDSEEWESEAESSEEGENKSESDELMDETKVSLSTETLQNPGQANADKIPTSEVNKENLENVEAKKDEIKTTGATEELSLRQLTKMLKQKLEITNKAKNVEDKNDPEVKARVALDKLPENQQA
ncbi:hypothetical protein ACFE04_023290 [Oxalis oulophora]